MLGLTLLQRITNTRNTTKQTKNKMTLTILPPELTETKPASSGKKDYDRREVYPSSLVDGESAVYRLLGTYASGHCRMFWRWATETKDEKGELRFSGFRFSSEYPGAVPPSAARAVDWSSPSRPKIEDEFVKPRKCLAWIAFSETEQRPVLLLIEQKSLQQGITEVMSDEDFSFDDDGIANFQIKISRKGAGLETSYSVLPKVKAPTKVELNAFEEVKATATVEKLLTGGHPFLESTEFKTADTTSDDTEF